MKESDAPQGQDNTTDRSNNPQNHSAVGNVPPRIGGHPPPPPEHNNPNENPNRPPWWDTPLRIGTFVGEIILILITVRIACIYSDQLGQMVESNNLAQRGLNITQQANVTIGRPDGTVAEIIWPKNKEDKTGLMVYFQNSGHLPAKFNWGNDSPIIAVLPGDPNALKESEYGSQWLPFNTDHVFAPMWRGKSRKQSGSFGWSGTVTIAGNSLYEGVLWELPKKRMLQLMNWDRPFAPNGKFEYCNGFGHRMCRKFSLRYFGNPYNRFFLVFEDECVQWEMQNLHPDPSFEYLNPCEVEAGREELKTTFSTLPKP